jgi:hypothetical protein
MELFFSTMSPDDETRGVMTIFLANLPGRSIPIRDINAASPSYLAEDVRSACKKKSIDKVLATISDLQIINGEYRVVAVQLRAS